MTSPAVPTQSHIKCCVKFPDSNSKSYKKCLIISSVIFFANLLISINFYRDYYLNYVNHKNHYETVQPPMSPPKPAPAPPVESPFTAVVFPQYLTKLNQTDQALLDYIRIHHVTPPSLQSLSVSDNEESGNTSSVPLPTKVFLRTGAANFEEAVHSEDEGTFSREEIFIECNPQKLHDLRHINRHAWIVDACISETDQAMQISMNVQSSRRHEAEETETFNRPAFPLYSIIAAIGQFAKIDIFNLDAQETEPEMLTYYPFHMIPIMTIQINVPSFEISQKQHLQLIMAYKGYNLSTLESGDYVFTYTGQVSQEPETQQTSQESAEQPLIPEIEFVPDEFTNLTQDNSDLLDYIWDHFVILPPHVLDNPYFKGPSLDFMPRPTAEMEKISIEVGEHLTRIEYVKVDGWHIILITCNPSDVPKLKELYPTAWIVKACISRSSTATTVSYVPDAIKSEMNESSTTKPPEKLQRPAFPIYSILAAFGRAQQIHSIKLSTEGDAQIDILENFPLKEIPINYINLTKRFLTPTQLQTLKAGLAKQGYLQMQDKDGDPFLTFNKRVELFDPHKASNFNWI